MDKSVKNLCILLGVFGVTASLIWGGAQYKKFLDSGGFEDWVEGWIEGQLTYSLENFLIEKYSSDLLEQAKQADYPTFGRSRVPINIEKEYYGVDHPLRESILSGREIINFLVQRDFDKLEAYFKNYQDELVHNELPESIYIEVFNPYLFQLASPNLEKYFTEWIALYPDSYVAHGLAGLYYSSLGWGNRGTSFIQLVPDENIELLSEFLSNAQSSFSTALALNPDFYLTYYQSVINLKAFGDDDIDTWLSLGLAKFPFSYDIRLQYMESLRPRWGGSRLEMRIFALDAQQFVNENSRLQMLLGIEARDVAQSLLERDDFIAAIAEFDNALFHGTNGSYLFNQAELLRENVSWELALPKYNLALENTKGVASVNAAYTLGLRALQNGQLEQAWEYFKNVVDSDSRNQYSSDVLEHSMNIDVDKTIELLQQKIFKNPSFPSYYFHLAEAYALKQDLRANDNYKKVADLCLTSHCYANEVNASTRWNYCSQGGERGEVCTLFNERFPWVLK